MQPLICLKNKESNKILSIYEDGKVYGTERGQLLCTLSIDSLKKITDLINENMYMFKSLVTHLDRPNPIEMNVLDKSRKKRNIKVIGWSQFNCLFAILYKEVNLSECFL